MPLGVVWMIFQEPEAGADSYDSPPRCMMDPMKFRIGNVYLNTHLTAGSERVVHVNSSRVKPGMFVATTTMVCIDARDSMYKKPQRLQSKQNEPTNDITKPGHKVC